MLQGMYLDLNREADKGLTPTEEKAILKAFSSPMGEPQRELLTHLRRFKKQAQVLNWILKGEVNVESFSAEYATIELKTKDGRCHRVELF